MHRLIVHPATAPVRVRCIAVAVATHDGTLCLDWTLESAQALLIPRAAPPERTDQLWTTTCFELFARHAGEAGYVEFNFSPSGQWAAYHFSDCRFGMTPHPMPSAPQIDIEIRGQVMQFAVRLDRTALPLAPLAIGLSAVIDEAEHGLSYWALAHPGARPDFHHRDCFAAQLGAAGGA